MVRIFRLFVILILASLWFSACTDKPPDIIINPGNQDDTSLIVASAEMPDFNLPADNPLTKQGVELGRMLFYDPLLSGNGKQACADCHNLNNSFTDNGKQFSVGITGAVGNRNSMPLFNLMWSNSLFWDGRAATLRELATMPIENPIEMNAKIPDVLVKLNSSDTYKVKFKEVFAVDTIGKSELSKALEQFLITLVSSASKFDKVNAGLAAFTADEQAGFDHMKIKGCFACHKGVLLHDNLFHNIGLDISPQDKGLGAINKKAEDYFKVKTPSLRNIALSAPYMHDGRFASLRDVINFYDNDIRFNSPNIAQTELEVVSRNKLSEKDKDQIIAFLNTLTDTEFINRKKFKSPF